jgi:hypothetical protein
VDSFPDSAGTMIDIVTRIQQLGWGARDPRMDGYNCWYNKQQLYQILWETQRQLELSPEFTDEQEWLLEQKQTQFLNKLQGNR